MMLPFANIRVSIGLNKLFELNFVDHIILAFLTITNIRHFWVASHFHYPMQTIKTMWKAIFQNKLTIHKANLPSFVKKIIIKTRCYVDLFRRPLLKCHSKMAAWERLVVVNLLFINMAYSKTCIILKDLF